MTEILKSGSRVMLRRLKQNDLQAFQSYRNDPIVGRYQDWTTMSDAEARNFLRIVETDNLLHPGQWSQIAIALKSDGKLLGDVGVHINSDETCSEIGFTLAREHWGNGHATEAVCLTIEWIFEQTTAQKIIGITDKENVASANVLTRAGLHHVKDYETEFRGAPCVESLYELAKP